MRSMLLAKTALFVGAGLACAAPSSVAQGDQAPAKKTGPPAFVSVWKMDLPGTVTRVGIGDVAGDKTPRLVTLDGAAVSIYALVEKELKPETKVELKGTAIKNMVVGKFAKGKPAIIAVPGSLIYKDGDKYATKAATQLYAVTGQVKFADGSETVFEFDGANEPGSYGVNLDAAQPMTEGNQLVLPTDGAGVYRVVVAHPSKEAFAMLMIPDEATKSGVMMMLDAREDGKLYGVSPWVTATETNIIAVGIDALSSSGDMKPVWKSAKITGKVLDLAYGLDPKGSKKAGLFILTTTGADDKGRSLEFLALD